MPKNLPDHRAVKLLMRTWRLEGSLMGGPTLILLQLLLLLASYSMLCASSVCVWVVWGHDCLVNEGKMAECKRSTPFNCFINGATVVAHSSTSAVQERINEREAKEVSPGPPSSPWAAMHATDSLYLDFRSSDDGRILKAGRQGKGKVRRRELMHVYCVCMEATNERTNDWMHACN